MDWVVVGVVWVFLIASMTSPWWIDLLAEPQPEPEPEPEEPEPPQWTDYDQHWLRKLGIGEDAP